MQDSIFTKIIKGDIPAHKIYEDDKTFAFLDIYPVTEGHALIIPKVQIEFLWDLEDDDYRAVMETSRKVALRLREVLNAPYIGEKVVGTDVPHAHVHLIPFYESHDFHGAQDFDSQPDHEALARLAEKLRF
jgi:histidine triad (HIT) family protein